MRLATGKHLLVAFVAGVTLLTPALASALPVTPTFNWRAARPGTDTSAWDATIGTHQWSLSGTTQTTPTTSYPGITSTFTFDGTGGATGSSFQGIAGGNPSDEDVSLEIWFRPADMNGGEQILFETGSGGDGLSLLLNDSSLFLRVKDNGTVVTTALYDLGTDSSEFFQAAITLSLDGFASLYVDGLLVDSVSAAGINDWSSNNGSGLGTSNGAVGGSSGGDLNSYGDFVGDIAIFRFYRDQVLTAAEVQQNFDAVATPEPGTAVLVALGLVGLAARRRFQRR